MIRAAVSNVKKYKSGGVKVGKPIAAHKQTNAVVHGQPGRSLWNGWKGGYQSGFKPTSPPPVAATSSPSVPAAQSSSKPPPIKSPVYGKPVEDSTYTQQVGLNQRNRDQLLAQLTNRQQQLGLQYGINFQRDPTTGALQDFSIDPNVDTTNPFSMAAELKRAYQNRERYNTNSMASAGQLYSGALQNAQNQAGFENQRGIDSLLKGFQSQYGDTLAQASQAQNQLDQANLDAYAALIGRQPAPAPDLPAAFGAPGGSIYNSKNAPTPAPSKFSSVKVANGWRLLYDANGKPVKFISPQEWAAMGGGA